MQQSAFEYNIGGQEFLDICSNKPLQLAPVFRKPFISPDRISKLKTFSDLSIHMGFKQKKIIHKVAEIDPLYCSYFKNVGILQYQRQKDFIQVKVEAESQIQVNMQYQINEMNKLIVQRQKAIHEDQMKKLMNLKLKPKNLQLSKVDDDINHDQSSTRNRSLTIDKQVHVKPQNFSSNTSPKRRIITEISTVESLIEKPSPSRRHRYPNDLDPLYVSPTQQKESSDSYVSNAESLRQSQVPIIDNYQKEQNLNSFAPNIMKFHNQNQIQVLSNKISQLMDKKNVSKQHFMNLLDKITKIQNILTKCKEEDNQAQFQRSQIKQQIVDQYHTYDQYEEFVEILQEMTNSTSNNWEQLLSYKFSNLVENQKVEQQDHSKFRKEYFKWQLQSQRSYFDIDKQQRRDFLAERRRKDQKII